MFIRVHGKFLQQGQDIWIRSFSSFSYNIIDPPEGGLSADLLVAQHLLKKNVKVGG